MSGKNCKGKKIGSMKKEEPKTVKKTKKTSKKKA